MWSATKWRESLLPKAPAIVITIGSSQTSPQHPVKHSLLETGGNKAVIKGLVRDNDGEFPMILKQFASWWRFYPPIWKNSSSNWIMFSGIGVKFQKIFKNHHLDFIPCFKQSLPPERPHQSLGSPVQSQSKTWSCSNYQLLGFKKTNSRITAKNSEVKQRRG